VKQRASFIKKVKRALIQRRDEMDNKLTAHSQEEVTDRGTHDSGDEALSLLMERLQTSLQKTEMNELHLIQDALVRINKEEYGICLDCSDPISEKRLTHFPYAARCIVCQEALEQ